MKITLPSLGAALESLRYIREKQLARAKKLADSESRADLQAEVNEAQRDWLYACSYFESVSEPELIDYAIYLMHATQKKYEYMLKKLKEQQA